MKEKLLKLVAESEFNEIKFTSKFLYDKPYKHSNKEDLRYLFWLTELNLWLYLNFKVVITQHMGHLERLEDQIYNAITELKDK